MKSIKCKDLGGACDLEFLGSTFEEVEAQSKQHGMEMFQSNDQEHLEAMEAMKELYSNEIEFAKWYQSKKDYFNNLPK